MQLDNDSDQVPTPILFTHYGDNWIRGSERCLLDLITHIDRDKFTPIVWCNSDLMVAEVRKLQITVYQSKFPILFGWNKPRFDIKSFIQLLCFGTQIIKKHNIKLIHANSGAPNQWLNLIARFMRVPLIAHLHSRNQLRDRISLGLHQVSMAVGVNPIIINQLIDDGMPRERTCVINNGIDTERLEQQSLIDLRKMYRFKSSDFIIATVGSLIPRKRMDLIISSVARLIKQGIPARLIIIGEGSERSNLEQQIKSTGLQHYVRMIGERDNIVGMLKSVDLFVSAASEEAFGLALSEACLAKLPVIAPKVGGISNLVIDGVTGILYPAENVHELTRQIRRLYRLPDVRHEMGNAGHTRIINHFTIEQNAKQFSKLYSKALVTAPMKLRWYSHWEVIKPLTMLSKKFFSRFTRGMVHG